MATNNPAYRSYTLSSLLLVSLMTLISILSGCGTSSTAIPSHPTGLTPTSTPTQQLKGMISEITLPTPHFSPGNMTAGPDGNLWFTEAASKGCQRGKIGYITPAGKISEFSLASDSVASNILMGPDGNLWFTDRDLDGWHDRIGRITPTGKISEFPVPELISNVYGITAGSDENLWYNVDPANHSQIDKIGRITPAGKISEFPLPKTGIVPSGITFGPDGTIWFTEMDSNKIGHLV